MWTDRLLASLGHGRSTTATPNAAPCSESLRNTPIQPQISTNLDAEAMEANDDVLDFDNSLAEDFSSEAPKTDEIQITNARAETIADSPRQNRTHRADLDAGPDSNPANCAVPIEGGTKHRKRRVVLKFAFLHRTYRKIVDRAKRKLSSSKAQPDRFIEDFSRTIEVCFRVNDIDTIFAGRALFDSGSPYNFISPAFAQLYGLSFDSEGAMDTLRLPGNNVFRSVAELKGRWAVKDKHVADRKLYFDNKFMPTTFYVSEADGEPFDVVIGSETILAEDLMGFKHRSGFAGFGRRRRPAFVDESNIGAATARQRENMANNSADKEAHEAALAERRRQMEEAAAAAQRTRSQASAEAERRN